MSEAKPTNGNGNGDSIMIGGLTRLFILIGLMFGGLFTFWGVVVRPNDEKDADQSRQLASIMDSVSDLQAGQKSNGLKLEEVETQFKATGQTANMRAEFLTEMDNLRTAHLLDIIRLTSDDLRLGTVTGPPQTQIDFWPTLHKEPGE